MSKRHTGDTYDTPLPQLVLMFVTSASCRKFDTSSACTCIEKVLSHLLLIDGESITLTMDQTLDQLCVEHVNM